MFGEDGFDFEKEPKERLFEIFFSANSDIVSNEVEKVLKRATLLEEFLLNELKIEEEELEEKLLKYEVENRDKLQKMDSAMCVEMMGRILSQNE